MGIFYILIEMSIVQVYMFSITSYYALRIAHFTKYISVIKATPHFFCLNGKMHILKIKICPRGSYSHEKDFKAFLTLLEHKHYREATGFR